MFYRPVQYTVSKPYKIIYWQYLALVTLRHDHHKMDKIHLEILLKRYYRQVESTKLSLNKKKVKSKKIIQTYNNAYPVDNDMKISIK